MTIAQVRTHRTVSPLRFPFVTALRTATAAESLLVEIVDSDGRSGWGEAPEVWPVTGASLGGCEAFVHGVAEPLLLGRDPDDLQARCREIDRAAVGNQTAKSAVEVALHDLAAQRLEISLVRLLGGTNLTVPTDVTVAAGSIDAMVQAAGERVAEGFRVLKLKVGADPDQDLARIRAICAALGPETTVRLDANQGWTPREAVRILDTIGAAGLPIELVEQPVRAEDIDGLAWVRNRVPQAIMADESVFGLRDLTEVIRRQAADVVNVKLAKSGGLRVARSLIEMAAAHQLGTCVGSMMEGPVGVGAAASLVAAYPTSVVSDLDAAWWLAESVVDGGPGYQDAAVILSSGPGLGVKGLKGDK